MIKEINNDNFLNFLALAKSNNPFTRFFVYEEKKEILGYIEINLLYDRIEIINLFVTENNRNRKIGSKLIDHLIEFAKTNNCINITLEVNIENTYALKLYKKYNFIEVAKREGYYNGTDGILMELIL